jgi:protein-disulfide isomerase
MNPAEQAAARRRERWILLVVLVGVVVLAVGSGIGVQAWRTGRAPAPSASTIEPSAPPVTLADGQPITFGPASATRTVTLFVDFHCPHCAEFEESYGPVLDQARQAGRIRLEIYPMSFIDEGSAAAANAFGCAAQSGFGPPYFDGLFANPTLRWNDEQLLALPAAVGATATPTFGSCVTGRANAGWVESVNAAAAERGVNSTPTLLVDGTAVDLTELTPDDLAAKINS